MTCATSSFMLVSLTLLADAFLFVFCASYLLYVYSNIISVDNIIITNNKMIQFSVHQGSCQHIFSQGFWCTFVYSWNGSYRNSLGLLLTQTKYITTLFRKKERQMQCPSQPRQELYSQPCSTVLLVYKPEGCYFRIQKDCLLTH